MLTEHTHTEPDHSEYNWALLPGTILDGGYEMQELLDADARRARFKIRVLGDRTIDAFASFFPVGGEFAEEQIARWEVLRRSPHANLSTPLAAGQRQLNGATVIYVVLRKADETLSGVLSERALTAQEASEVLLNCSRALEHLIGHGLVHGSIAPEQVLAVGDSIQLSTEGVRRAEGETGPSLLKQKYVAPEDGGGSATAAADVWCLGATVFETLTQKECAEGCREKAKELPGALGWVLEACLDPDPSARVTAQQIPVLFKNRPARPVSMPVAAVEAPKTADAAAEESKAASATAVAAGLPSATIAGAAGLTQVAAAQAAAGHMAADHVAASQTETDALQARPKVSSASQARVKAFKQAGFDALTAPETAPHSGGVAPRATNSVGSAAAGVPGVLGTAPPAAESGSGVAPIGSNTFRGREAELRRVPERRGIGFEPEVQPSRLWMYVAAGVVVLLIVVWASWPKQAKTLQTAPANTPAANAGPGGSGSSAQKGTAAAAWPTRTLEPEKASSGVAAPAASAEAARHTTGNKTEAGAVNGTIWRVVVYTFSKPDDAQKKVHAINAKHPRLQAQVFSPNGQTGPYLVTVGGRMSREDALRWRSRAIGSGMPRDAYVQNYKQ